jgi:hypothetical protein
MSRVEARTAMPDAAMIIVMAGSAVRLKGE